MVLVAVVGLATFLVIQDERTTKRRTVIRRIMMNHLVLAGAYRGEPVGCIYTDEQIRVLNACSSQSNEPMAAYHKALADKYRRAYNEPWRVISPDPPPPADGFAANPF